MDVLRHWDDATVARIAVRLGTPTRQRRDDVRRVLKEANAVPARLLRDAEAEVAHLRAEVECLGSAREEDLRDEHGGLGFGGADG